jgi:hypothetical protein
MGNVMGTVLLISSGSTSLFVLVPSLSGLLTTLACQPFLLLIVLIWKMVSVESNRQTECALTRRDCLAERSK